MRKFWTSMEPFWDLKIGKYVEYFTRVSSEYITSWALLSLTNTAGQTSNILLADVIPWINKASLMLYIACMVHAMPRPTWHLEAVWHYWIHLLWLKHRNLSLLRLRVDLRLHLCDRGTASMWLVDCAHTILTTFTIFTMSAIIGLLQLLGMWLSFHT